MADKIFMSFPANTKYIGTIRLAVSGLADMLDYGLDEIEDFKTCVSESCLLLLCGQTCSKIDLEFEIQKELKVYVKGTDVKAAEESTFEEFNDEISRIMIEALSDESEFTETDGILQSIQFIKSRVD